VGDVNSFGEAGGKQVGARLDIKDPPVYLYAYFL
jgi:hypothetical protein